MDTFTITTRGRMMVKKPEEPVLSLVTVTKGDNGWYVYFDSTLESKGMKTSWYLHSDGIWRTSPLLGEKHSGYYKKKEEAEEMLKKHPRQ
jgi:hypothetical protein